MTVTNEGDTDTKRDAAAWFEVVPFVAELHIHRTHA